MKGMHYTETTIFPAPDFTFVPVQRERTYCFDYIQVPLLAKLSWPTQSHFRPSLLLGPCAAININAKSKTKLDSSGVELYPGTKMNYSSKIDDAEDVVFGITVGAEFALCAGKGELAFDVRYDHGLTKGRSNIKGYDRSILCMIGYSF